MQELANIVKVSRNTVQRWESGAGFNDKYGDRLCAALGVDLNDLLEDGSEILHRAEVRMPSISAARETQQQYRNQDVAKEEPGHLDFSLPEAMRMVTDVLTSRTSYATALYLNIQHFDRAIQAENRIGVLEDENKRLNRKIEGLEGRLTALEDKLSRGDQAGGPAADPEPATPLLNGTTGT